jgi:hypothetical protein
MTSLIWGKRDRESGVYEVYESQFLSFFLTCPLNPLVSSVQFSPNSNEFNHPSSPSSPSPSIIIDPLRVVDDQPNDFSSEPSIALGLP